jgi:filamentous hemagglutinin
VNAANVDNQTGADLNSSNTTVNAANAITNEGRIEGDSVTTHSASLTNTATIVGNTVTLDAGSIANTGAAAVMAAASQLNLYSPGDISNMGGANIFSLGDINIAADGTRDANGVLANRSNSVTNDQSTIEAQGNIEVATQTLTNTRPAPTVETVTTDVETEHQTKRDKYMACTPTNGDKGHCTQEMWDNGYKNPLNSTFSSADVVSTASGPDATDRVLVVNVNGQPRTIWYNTLTANADGTITVNYWDDYNPNVNYVPDTEYPTRSDGHKGYQRVEVSRDTTTTTQRDQVTGPQAQQAQLLAGGNMMLANAGGYGGRQLGGWQQQGQPEPARRTGHDWIDGGHGCLGGSRPAGTRREHRRRRQRADRG